MNERTLSYQMSQKLTEEDLQSVSAAGMCYHNTAGGSYIFHSGPDVSIDGVIDL